jgi:hypothetical protein
VDVQELIMLLLVMGSKAFSQQPKNTADIVDTSD